MAPEVVLQDYDEQADVWSVGILMWQLLTGRFPFWDDIKSLSLQQVLSASSQSNTWKPLHPISVSNLQHAKQLAELFSAACFHGIGDTYHLAASQPRLGSHVCKQETALALVQTLPCEATSTFTPCHCVGACLADYQGNEFSLQHRCSNHGGVVIP